MRTQSQPSFWQKVAPKIRQTLGLGVLWVVGSWCFGEEGVGVPENAPGPSPATGSQWIAAASQPTTEKTLPTQTPLSEAKNLFDGRTLTGWKVLDELAFKTHGKVEVRDGQILLYRGEPFTGVQWTGQFPRSDYEVLIEARRVDGDDFFCGLVFPVGQADCSLIVGGWGGSTVGLSNIDGEPAAENETAKVYDFEKGRWYSIRLRVTDQKILVWIDQEKLVDFKYPDRKLSIRWDQEPMRPFGICTWQTTGAVRNVQLRRLGKDEPPAERATAKPEPAKQKSSQTEHFQPNLSLSSAEQPSGLQPPASTGRLPTAQGTRSEFAAPKTFDGKLVHCRVELQEIGQGFRIYRFWYPSPIQTPVEQNNTIPAEYYLPDGAETGPARPAVIVLHILNGNYELERLLCRTLALRGVPALMFKLPYYDERAPAGGRKRLLQEPELFVQALPQTIADCRRTIDVLAARPEVDSAKISLAGISLGGIVGATAAAADGRIHRAALLLAGGDLLAIIHHCREARPLHQFLESLPAQRRQQMEKALEEIDPLHHASALRERAQAGRVLMVNAAQDEVIPRACTEKLAQALGMADRVVWLDGLGHYTAIAALPQTLAQTTAFFAEDLPAEAKPPVVSPPKPDTPLEVAGGLVRELLTILLQEPNEGRCRLLDISAEVSDPEGKKHEGRLRWIRGDKYRFRLEVKVTGFPELQTGQGDRPWLVSTKRVFVGRINQGQEAPTSPQRPDPLKFVPDRHLGRIKVWTAALRGAVQMPSLLQSLLEAEEIQPASGPKVADSPTAAQTGRVLQLRQKEKKQNTLQMVLTPEGRPSQIELSIDKVRAKITVHGWQVDAPAPAPLFDPPDLPIQQVDPEDLVRIWSALVEFMMEKME